MSSLSINYSELKNIDNKLAKVSYERYKILDSDEICQKGSLKDEIEDGILHIEETKLDPLSFKAEMHIVSYPICSYISLFL